MNTKSINRVMIETAVDRGIRDMTEDPKRSMRRLADLGKRFSTGVFQKATFSLITSILRNDESPYYKILENFLTTVDHKSIKNFGMNVGYDSWTFGARVIRTSSKKLGFAIPWIIIFHYDPQNGKVSASKINEMIELLNPLGTNTFGIVKEHGTPADPELLKVIKAHPTCAFILFINDSQISISEVNKLKMLGNTAISVNASHEDALYTCRALKDSRALYVIHYMYSSSETDKLTDIEYIDNWCKYGSPFVLLIQKGSFAGLAGNLAKDSRLNQDFPILLWDLYYDIKAVNKVISGEESFVEIDEDGYILYPDLTKKNIIDDDILSILKEVSPPYPSH